MGPTTSIYVGNLPYSATTVKIEELFSPFNPTFVGFAEGRNFAYVEVPADQFSQAVSSLDGVMLDDHELTVSRATFREPRSGATQ